ncbi:MAG: SDR family NAD(P)-dependent oxidoreductase [Ferrovibrionaceae bacterium]
MEFADKTFVVTGAAGNLGRAVARHFADRGARLALLDHDQARLLQAYGPDHANRACLQVDLTDQASVDQAIEAAAAKFGRIDGLIAIAGGFRMGEQVHELSDKTWSFLMDINAGTLLRTVHAVVPRLISGGGGKIVTVGARAALAGAAEMGAYTAAKAAVIRLTEAMSAELKGRNINVNGVLPSIIDTPENRQAMPAADPAKWVAPADLAAVIGFLASDAGRALHGAIVPVSGLS